MHSDSSVREAADNASFKSGVTLTRKATLRSATTMIYPTTRQAASPQPDTPCAFWLQAGAPDGAAADAANPAVAAALPLAERLREMARPCLKHQGTATPAARLAGWRAAHAPVCQIDARHATLPPCMPPPVTRHRSLLHVGVFDVESVISVLGCV